MVDASGGDNLAGDEAYGDATADVPDDSAADVYVDIGALIEEAGEARSTPKRRSSSTPSGSNPKKRPRSPAVVPGSDQVEIDLSTDLSGENPPSGDASELLGTLPGTRGRRLRLGRIRQALQRRDRPDRQGRHPGLGAAEPVEGDPEGSGHRPRSDRRHRSATSASTSPATAKRPWPALSSSKPRSESEAKNTVSNLGLFLRQAGISGVTEVNGEASGFSIRSPELGRQPVVVVAKGSRIAIGYGLASVGSAFQETGKTLADSAPYKDATGALGSTPITAFVNGPSALNLANALIPPGDEGFAEAKPYLQKIEYLALGSEASDDLATAKLIVGLK